MIHPNVEYDHEYVEIGDGVVVCAGTILTVNILVEAHAQINLDCTVGHDAVIGAYSTLSPGVHISGNVTLEPYTFIGTGAVTVNGVAGHPLTIGSGAVIGAGAVVTRDIAGRCDRDRSARAGARVSWEAQRWQGSSDHWTERSSPSPAAPVGSDVPRPPHSLRTGSRVAIGDLDAAFTRQVATELGDGAIGLQLDVTSRESFAGFLDEVERRLGQLDVLVNNAGIQPVGEFAGERDAVTERTLEVNLGGIALGCKLALERLLPRDTGHIVNIASGLGRTPVAGGASYCASKYGVVGLTEALRAELAATRVELHLVLPGLVDTEMSAGLQAACGDAQMLSPDDVGLAIVQAVQSGRAENYVPRSLGTLVAARRMVPRRLVALGERLLRSDSLMTDVDEPERAAYQARIAPAGRRSSDPAASVASAAAVVADAVRADGGEGEAFDSVSRASPA